MSAVAESLARALATLTEGEGDGEGDGEGRGGEVGLAQLDPRALRARAAAAREVATREPKGSAAAAPPSRGRSAAGAEPPPTPDRVSATLPGLDAWLERHPDGIWRLATPARPRTPALSDAKAVMVALDALREAFTFTVAELEPQMNERTLAALDAADRLLLVTDPTVPSLRGTQRILRLCRRLNYPDEKLCVVVNRYDSATGVSAADVVAVLKRELYWKIPEASAATPDLGPVYQRLATKLRDDLG